MGNLCSSYSSTATQTRSTVSTQNVEPEVEIDEEPVKQKTWDDVFDHVARVDLWEGTPRSARPEWKSYVTKIDELSRMERKEIDDDKVREIMQGRQHDVVDRNHTLVLYVCSTGTDTEAERTVLMKDVYPFIREVCRKLALEFEVVDLRWGVKGADITDESIQTYLRELQRCSEMTSAAFFLCFISDEYGTRILPQEIEEETLETITAYLINNELGTGLIKQFYVLDKNSIRRKYVLRKDAVDSTCQINSSGEKEKLVQIMKETIPQCFPCGAEMISKYFGSLYEHEIRTVLEGSNRTIFIKKVVEKTSQDEGLIDDTDTEEPKEIYDAYDHEQLDNINKEISEKLGKSKDEVFTLNYDDMSELASGDNVIQMTDFVCEKLLKHVVRHYKASEPMIKDRILQEVIQHNKHSLTISQDLYGRETEIETVRKYLEDHSVKLPLVVHGLQGVGKSAFMAAVARRTNLPHHVTIFRHIGITADSKYVKDLIASVCTQLIRAYEIPIWNVSASYKDLIKCFRDCLSLASKTQPIVLFLDSLDTLADEHFAYNLRWLQLDKELPENVRIVLSTMPGQSFDALRRVLPASQFLDIVPLPPTEVTDILQKKLSSMGRQITYDQTQKLVEPYEKSQSSLILSIGTTIAASWRSFDSLEAQSHIDDMLELTEAFMKNAEESHDHVVVQHVLAYITASKYGLSVGELDDILSCDDEVLDVVFRGKSPSIRRIPPAVWLQIKHDLNPFLVERDHRGSKVITWCHPQVADLAGGRYLTKPFGNSKEPFERKASLAIADYFENKWSNGKVYSNLGTATIGEKFAQLENRHILNQPLVTSGDISTRRHLNTRKLSELPYQLTLSKDWTRFVNDISLTFVQAKFEDGLGFECFRDVSVAAKLSDNKTLKQLSRLIASNMTVLWKEPFAVYQIASQSQRTSPIFKMLKACDARYIKTRFIRNVSVLKEENTCEMTLLGHSAGVRYCDLSPTGDMIVSTADDGSMNIWYVITGMELAAMTSLPLPVDSEHVELIPSNPCSFSPDGNQIAIGTEDGSVLLLDNTGTMINQESTDTERITCIKFSRDGKILVTSFRQGQLYFWDVETLEHRSTIQLEETITGLDVSPDGQLLAVACTKGLVLVDMTTRVILSYGVDNLMLTQPEQEDTPEWFAMCCVFHPNGDEVLIGSTDNSISQWKVSDGRIVNKIMGHYGWVTSIKMNKSGDIMFTASADRTIKVWTFESKWRCTSTLIGHSDIVTMVSLDPVKESYLVSTSLDGSIKVWNIKSLKPHEDITDKDDGFEEGSDVTDQDGDDDVSEHTHAPFNTLSISPSSGIIVYSKGTEKCCRIRKPGCPTVNTSKLPSPIKRAIFTADGLKVVVLDNGVNKDGEEQSLYKTSVYIFDTETGSTDHVIQSGEFGDDERPTSVCCGAWFIAIGTDKGDVHVFDDKAFENLQQITWHDVITEMASCTVKNYVIAISYKQAIIWKIGLDRYETIAYLPETEFAYTRCVFSPIGTCLVTGLENGEIHVWNISDTDITLAASKTEHISKVKDISFSRSGDIVVTCADRSMRVWDINNGFSLKCAYYSTIERVVCVEEDVVLAGDFSGKLNTLTW